jgi:hypothetical protein
VNPTEFCLWLADALYREGVPSTSRLVEEIYIKLQTVRIEATIGEFMRMDADKDN